MVLGKVVRRASFLGGSSLWKGGSRPVSRPFASPAMRRLPRHLALLGRKDAFLLGVFSETGARPRVHHPPGLLTTPSRPLRDAPLLPIPMGHGADCPDADTEERCTAHFYDLGHSCDCGCLLACKEPASIAEQRNTRLESDAWHVAWFHPTSIGIPSRCDPCSRLVRTRWMAAVCPGSLGHPCGASETRNPDWLPQEHNRPSRRSGPSTGPSRNPHFVDAGVSRWIAARSLARRPADQTRPN